MGVGYTAMNTDMMYMNVPANRVPCAIEGGYLENRAEYCSNYLNKGYRGLKRHYALGIPGGRWHSINVPTEPGFSHRYFKPSGRVVKDKNGNPIKISVQTVNGPSNINVSGRVFRNVTRD